MMLTLMLLANGGMVAAVKAKKEELVRRESSASTLATDSTGDTKEASAFPQDSGVSEFQSNPAVKTMEAYVETRAGSSTCPTGFETITDAATCRNAGVAL